MLFLHSEKVWEPAWMLGSLLLCLMLRRYNNGMKVGKSAATAERGKSPARVFCITHFPAPYPFLLKTI
jgi:hypothetical protein